MQEAGAIQEERLGTDIRHAEGLSVLHDASRDALADHVAPARHLFVGHAVGELDRQLVGLGCLEDEEAAVHVTAALQDLSHLLDELLEIEGRAESAADLDQGLVAVVLDAKLVVRFRSLENLGRLCSHEGEEPPILFGKVGRLRAVDADDSGDLVPQDHGDGQLAADVRLDHDVARVLAHVGDAQGLAGLGDPAGDPLADLQDDLVGDVGAEPSRAHDTESLVLRRLQDDRAGRRSGVTNAGVEDLIEQLARVECGIDRHRDLLKDREAIVQDTAGGVVVCDIRGSDRVDLFNHSS